jgi:tetratricopeptide (TPR) repeat protein
VIVDERIEHSAALYERAVFGGDPSALEGADQDLDRVEADLALARGRIMHGHFLTQGREHPQELEMFERAADLFRQAGDVKCEAEALCWVGIYHQVVRNDDEAALPMFERAAELAGQAGDKLILSYALRHQGIAEHLAGRLDEARERLEESIRLRREVGFAAGVAANMVGLAYIAAGQGRRDEAFATLDTATIIAEASGAGGVLRSIEEARSDVSSETTSESADE